MMPNVILIIATLVAVALSPFLVLFMQDEPGIDEVALVVSAPWGKGAAQVAADSDVPEVAPERAPMGALVMLTDNQSVDRLYQNGAWFVVNGQRVLELCVN